MVFRGRPSKACFACRGRRIKCDKNQLGCGQCSRMEIPCPGYPDPIEQSYRDQSEIVMKKAEANYRKGSRRRIKANTCSSDTSSVTTPLGSEVSLETGLEALCHNPSLHLDTIAVTEFMTTYIPQSPFDYLSKISTHQNPEGLMSINIRAVSLAMAASKLKDLRLLHLARRLYATALSDTNTALIRPGEATRDSTLVSVLLLGLFEALACQVTGASSNWAAHTRGALALLRLRGKDQFRSALGRRLFDQMCGILTFDTMMRKMPLPPDLLELVSIAQQLHWESPRISFVNLVGEISEPPCVLWDINLLPSAKVVKALSLDQRVLQYTRGLPSDYGYQEFHQTTEHTLKSGWDTYGCIIHQYGHHHAARLWNACRVLRIMLNSVIHRALRELPLSHEGKWAQQRAVATIKDAATDICATVPQFLDPAKYDTIGIEASREARVATLIAALSVVKAESLAPQTAKSYAADRLKHLGKQFEVPQAESAANGLGLDVLHSGFHMFYVY
ncbi:C6 zinc finger domain-containing protein [Paraphaeosphaeria sporulosa]